MSLTQITVTATYRNPSGAPSFGTVSFTPSASLIQAGAGIVTLTEISVVVIFGVLSVVLYADDDPGTVPTGQGYLVTETFGPDPVEYSIVVPHTAPGGTIDLSAMEHVYINTVPRFGSSASDEDFVRSQRLDQLAVPGAVMDFGGQPLTNLGIGGAQFPPPVTAGFDAATMVNLLNPWCGGFSPGTQVTAGTGTAGTVFTMATNYGDAYLNKGDKIRWCEDGVGSVWKYGVIASAAPVSGVFTVTLVPTTSYSMSSGTWPIEITSGKPQDFPTHFGWNPQWSTGTVVPGTGFWAVNGGLCTIGFAGGTVTATATSFTGVLPIAAGLDFQFMGYGVSNSVATMVAVGTFFGVLGVLLAPSGNATWPTGPRSVQFCGTYPI